MKVRKANIFYGKEIKNLMDLSSAIKAVEGAFAAYCQGRAVVPGVINFDLSKFQGEVHVKGAYIEGERNYVIKIASGFYKNPEMGLPVGNGLILVFEAQTGQLEAILLDEGYLTEVRTAAAGAIAAKYLAKEQINRVAIIGSGVQARFQLKALAEVRNFKEVRIWSRSPENVCKYIEEMKSIFPEVKFIAADSAEYAVKEADLVITATPSRKPIVRAEWLSPGVHITAMGSDGPEKQELYPEVLARADKIYCDSIAQCQHLGEVHHGLESRTISLDKVNGEIGEIILRYKPGRLSEEEITVADLTGLGVQDAVIASLFLQLHNSLEPKAKS